MLVLLAGVAFAQESRFEIAIGPGLQQSTTDHPGLGYVAGGADVRWNPNGLTFRAGAMDSVQRPTFVTRNVDVQAGVVARQPRLTVGGGVEFAMLEDPTRHFPASGVFLDFAFTYPRWVTRNPMLAPLSAVWIGGTVSYLNDSELRFYAVDQVWFTARLQSSHVVALGGRFQWTIPLGDPGEGLDSTALLEIRFQLGRSATPLQGPVPAR